MVSSKMVLFGVLLKHTQFKYPMCYIGEVSHGSVGIRYSATSSLQYWSGLAEQGPLAGH